MIPTQPYFRSNAESVEKTSVSYPGPKYINFNVTNNRRLGSRTKKLLPVRTAELVKFLEAEDDSPDDDEPKPVDRTSDSSEDEANRNILDTTLIEDDDTDADRLGPLMPGVSWLEQTPAKGALSETPAVNKLCLRDQPSGARAERRVGFEFRNPGAKNGEMENSMQTPAGQRIQYSMRSSSAIRSAAKSVARHQDNGRPQEPLNQVARLKHQDYVRPQENHGQVARASEMPRPIVQARITVHNHLPPRQTPVGSGDRLKLASADTVLREKNLNVLEAGAKVNGARGQVRSTEESKHLQNTGARFCIPGAAVCSHRAFQTVQVRRQTYLVLDKLGEGASCQVYSCLAQDTLQPRAIKVVNLAVDAFTATGYINEVKLLRDLQGNGRVIKMFEYEQVQQTLFVVLERGDADFSMFLRTIATEPLVPTHIVLCYWIEMLKCVKEIHDNGIIHSDLKPSNFLIVAGRLKLIDFGIASRLSAEMTSVVKTVCGGTFNYISPEALLDSRGANSPGDGRPRIRISYKSDVWSLGCILYQMIYRRTPFHSYGNPMAKITVISDRNHCIEYPRAEGVSPKLIGVIRACLVYDMRRRPTVQELLSMDTADLNC